MPQRMIFRITRAPKTCRHASRRDSAVMEVGMAVAGEEYSDTWITEHFTHARLVNKWDLSDE